MDSNLVAVLVGDSHGSSDGSDEEAGLEDKTGGTSSRLALNGTSGGSNDDLGRGLNRRGRGKLNSSGLNRDRSLGSRSLDGRRVDDAGCRSGSGVHWGRKNDRRRRGDHVCCRGSPVGAVRDIGGALGDGHIVGGGGGEGGGEKGLVGSNKGSGREGEDGGEAHLDL